MRFLSNGDYIFPFHFPQYWAEHFYTWSYQSGAANPDGIFRLPGRLIDLVVFAAFGNLAIGYFYAISCLIIAFLAFLWFSAKFLDVRMWGIRILGASFFALNPIFLGNLSKIGLVLAVAMLPVALTALKLGFEKRRFSYFLLVVLALNISLIHPFTFSVNLLVCGVYLIYLLRAHSTFARDNLYKFGLVIATALLLNAYLILPLFALGTVDKGAIGDTVSRAPVDYTSLVDIANTGDIFTALSLSKGVLKDYEFFGAMTWPFYFLGVFGFYALLLGVYIRTEKRTKPLERRRFVLCLGIFLLLLVLSTASYLHADALIKFFISLPGGWMFRSPLKWQLYMPVVLFTALMVALKYVQSKNNRRMLYAGFAATFVLMNGYLFTQIYERLFVPRTLTYFGTLANTDLKDKNLLFVNSAECMAFARDNPGVSTELNQVFISQEVQVKRISSASLHTVNLAQYDFVLGCTGTMDETMLGRQYHFVQAGDFAGNKYHLYRNNEPRPYATAVTRIFAAEAQNLGNKAAFTENILNQPFNFIAPDDTTHPAIGLQDAFDNLSPASVQSDALREQTKPIKPGEQTLFIMSGEPLQLSIENNRITVVVQGTESEDSIQSGIQPLTIAENEKLDMTYRDAAFTYQNQVSNPSLEQGLWKKQVGDCNAYDDQAAIFMNLHKQSKTNGQQSLELKARRHIACTGPDAIAVKPGAKYLLSFDYQSIDGAFAGYNAGFDDTERRSTGERLPDESGQWQSYSTEITAPADAKNLNLLVYAYPSGEPGSLGTARYDNFRLVEIPNVRDRFFLVSAQDGSAPKAPSVSSTKRNPTKHLLHIKNAREPFYITTKETYDRLWQLRPDDGTGGLAGLFKQTSPVSSKDHVRTNGNMNGWYIDPAALCAQHVGCTTHADGSYDIKLVMEFSPQRWFYIGCIITLITGTGTATYIVFDIRRSREQKGVKL